MKKLIVLLVCLVAFFAYQVWAARCDVGKLHKIVLDQSDSMKLTLDVLMDISEQPHPERYREEMRRCAHLLASERVITTGLLIEMHREYTSSGDYKRAKENK